MPPKNTGKNPIFVELLNEWKQELEESKPGHHMINTLGKAINSLKASDEVHPTPLDCQGLKFMGPVIRNGLDKRLKALGKNSASSSQSKSGDTAVPKKRKPRENDVQTDLSPPKKRGRPPKPPVEPDFFSDDEFSMDGTQGSGISYPGSSQAANSHAEEIYFWYIDTDNTRVTLRDQSAVEIVGYELLYRIEIPETYMNHPFTRELRRITRAGAPKGSAYALMQELHAIRWVRCPAPVESSLHDSIHRPTGFGSASKSLLETLLKNEEAVQPMPLDPSRQRLNLPEIQRASSMVKAQTSRTQSASSSVFESHKSSVSTGPSIRASSSSVDIRAGDRFVSEVSTSFKPSATASGSLTPSSSFVGKATAVRIRARKAPRLSSHVPPPPAIDPTLEDELDEVAREAGADIPVRTLPTQNLGNVLPFEPITFPPNSYDIYLVLDSREVKTQKNRDYIPNELKKKGVSVLRRGLELGDVMWVARKRGYGVAGEGEDAGDENEAVLDFIIERKRIDDLVGSIKDGRFHEQKFRLNDSGIGHVYYLVEEYESKRGNGTEEGSMTHRTMDKAVFTALSSTQIVEGFYVKETRSLDDTIEYLVGLHQSICELHQNRPLHIIPPKFIKRRSYKALQTHLRSSSDPSIASSSYLTTYPSFRELNKSGSVTLRDYFARMLLCVNGLSSEKVATIIAVYETPIALWTAFIEAEQVEREGKEPEEKEDDGVLAKEKGKGRAKKKSAVPSARLLLTTLEPKGTRKHINDALARKVYDLFRAQTYD